MSGLGLLERQGPMGQDEVLRLTGCGGWDCVLLVVSSRQYEAPIHYDCISLASPACRLEQVYLRGSQIRMIVLPDILKNAPIFK